MENIKLDEKIDFAKFVIAGETIDGNIAIENLYIRLDAPGSIVSKFAYKELLCENFGEYDTVSVSASDICGVCGVPYCKSCEKMVVFIPGVGKQVSGKITATRKCAYPRCEQQIDINSQCSYCDECEKSLEHYHHCIIYGCGKLIPNTQQICDECLMDRGEKRCSASKCENFVRSNIEFCDDCLRDCGDLK